MLPNYLANIKSSGIYRFVFDKSEMPGQEAETLRLVIGYSEKGPFNTPVYVKTEDEFRKIYGGTSKKMERYGMWFHRMAIQALKAGPILAFNLKNFEGDYDEGVNEVEYTTFNPNKSIFHFEDDEIANNLQMAIKDLYNTDRFWTLEPEQLEEYVNDKDEEDHVNNPKGYITIATTDSKDTSVTVFMRGYEPKGYDVPFMEWYSAVLNGEELPSYLEGHERDLVSQYWAEMFIFKGQFTPEIAASDKLAKFFNVEGDQVTLKPYIVNAFGEKIDTLDALAANDASNFVKKYAGVLLPDFRNASNTVISLDAQVNGDNYIHKLMMRFNQDMLYSIDPEDEDGFQLSDLDTTGWSQGPVREASDRNMMSIVGIEPIVFNATFSGSGDDAKWTYDEGEHAGEAADFYKYEGLTPTLEEYTMTFADEDGRFAKTGIREGDSIFAGILAHVVKISTSQAEEHEAEEGETPDFWKVNGTGEFTTKPEIRFTGTGHWTVNGYGSTYGQNYNEPPRAMFSPDTTDPNGGTHENGYWWVETWPYPTELSVDPAGRDGNDNLQEVNDGEGDRASYTYYDREPVIAWKIDEAGSAEPWECAGKTFAEEPVITGWIEGGTQYEVQLDKSEDDGVDVSAGIYKCVGSVTYTSKNVKPLYLKGYVYGNPKPETTRMYDKWQWQKYMLQALTNYKGLRIALTSRVDLEYRYLVDTFEGFVEPECKSMLSTLCKEKDNAFAILNFPAIKTFSKSHQQGGPSFRNEKGEFDTKYIAMGGNPLKPMPMMFTLPSQENGASWCGFFTALKIRDINTGVKEDVPSAALVSNNFMKKYTTYLPYTVIAGTNRGIVREQGLLGPDFNFSREDLDNLEPFGVNCMVYVDRKGTCINSNQTAKQNPVTTLSKISTRELVIFLQDEIEKLLLDYHWDFNTPNLQQRIKDRADVILETAKNNGGVYVYNNQCDEYNNTDDVINNEMFVLSTSIEPGMGAGKMVQELYIYRKGGMSSALVSDTGA